MQKVNLIITVLLYSKVIQSITRIKLVVFYQQQQHTLSKLINYAMINNLFNIEL